MTGVQTCALWVIRPGSNVGTAPATVSVTFGTEPEGSRTSFRPIEEIRVGQRVVTDLPEGILDLDGRTFDRSLLDGATRANPATWRLVRMRAEERWQDGTIDDINIETLQPLVWIESNGLKVGRKAPIPLDLVEMGLPSDLRGTVLAIDNCPVIEPPPGRVVLTTVNHLNHYVFDVSIGNSTGDRSSLGVTGHHKIFSASRGTWIPADHLDLRSRLNGRGGSVAVRQITPRPGTYRVFNLTVEQDHVYRVGTLGVLVHNSCYDPNQPKGPGNWPPEYLERYSEELLDELWQSQPQFFQGIDDTLGPRRSEYNVPPDHAALSENFASETGLP